MFLESKCFFDQMFLATCFPKPIFNSLRLNSFAIS